MKSVMEATRARERVEAVSAAFAALLANGFNNIGTKMSTIPTKEYDFHE